MCSQQNMYFGLIWNYKKITTAHLRILYTHHTHRTAGGERTWDTWNVSENSKKRFWGSAEKSESTQKHLKYTNIHFEYEHCYVILFTCRLLFNWKPSRESTRALQECWWWWWRQWQWQWQRCVHVCLPCEHSRQSTLPVTWHIPWTFENLIRYLNGMYYMYARRMGMVNVPVRQSTITLNRFPSTSSSAPALV